MLKNREVLIVIDMLKGFIDQGPLADPSMHRIVDENVRLIQSFLDQDKPVLSFQDAHGLNDLEFENYPPHCLKGTIESELIDELKIFESKMIQVEKQTTNGFFAPVFQEFLKANPALKKMTVIGCCTDICILNFTLTMKTYAQSIQKPLEIVVIEKAVDTFGLPGHDKLTMHQNAIDIMKRAGILIE